MAGNRDPWDLVGVPICWVLLGAAAVRDYAQEFIRARRRPK